MRERWAETTKKLRVDSACHKRCPLCRVTRWSLMLRAHKGGPRGPPVLTPSPLLTPELEIWLGKGTSSLPLACCGGRSPPSRPPLPSCSGQCPNASTSHLGLAKPVPTVGGAGVTRSVESTHPWREHNGPRTGWLTGLRTDNTVNRAEWQTASQNNEKPAEQWLENISHHYRTHLPRTHTWTYAHMYTHTDVCRAAHVHACTHTPQHGKFHLSL